MGSFLSIRWKKSQLAASINNRVLLALATLSMASCDFSGSRLDGDYAAGVAVSKDDSSIDTGAAQSLAFSTPASGTAIAGTALSSQPVVTAKDANGNVVSNYSNSITFAGYSDTACSTAVSSSLSSHVSTASSGAATFTALTALKTSVRSLQASDGTLSTSCLAIAMSPGSPASITIHAGNNQANAYVGSLLGTALQVLVQDSYGNAVPNVQVTWAVDQTRVIGQLYVAPTSTTDSNGFASNLYTMGSSAGNNGIIASVTSGLGTFSVSFVETGIALPTPSLSYSGSTGITGLIGTPMSISPTTLLPAGKISSCELTSGSLPPGLSLNTSSCVISGTPSRDQTTQAVVVTASNSSGSGSASVSITVNCYSDFIEFNYTGADQTFTPSCSQVTARMWGAGGGSPASTTRGGAGGFVKGTLSLDLTKSYKIIVGQGPGVGSASATYGGGGPGGLVAGGGRTAIQDTYGDILTAGGGGGTNYQYSCYGGGGGGLTGLAGIGGVGFSPGQGGSQIAGGAGAHDGGGGSNVVAGKGSQYQGGPGYSIWGGGGGGGYFGGGGGSTTSSGGGGGSSYYGGTVGVAVTNGVSIAATTGATSAPGGSSDMHYKSGVGTTATNTKAGNGYAILYWGALARSVSVSGSNLTILGFNLTADTAVTFSGGSSCTGITVLNSGDRITCTIPNGLVNQDVTITVPGYPGKVFNNVL